MNTRDSRSNTQSLLSDIAMVLLSGATIWSLLRAAILIDPIRAFQELSDLRREILLLATPLASGFLLWRVVKHRLRAIQARSVDWFVTTSGRTTRRVPAAPPDAPRLESGGSAPYPEGVLDERYQLITKRFLGPLTSEEESRLGALDADLERIELARADELDRDYQKTPAGELDAKLDRLEQYVSSLKIQSR